VSCLGVTVDDAPQRFGGSRPRGAPVATSNLKLPSRHDTHRQVELRKTNRAAALGNLATEHADKTAQANHTAISVGPRLDGGHALISAFRRNRAMVTGGVCLFALVSCHLRLM